jgi:hypothetical protein
LPIACYLWSSSYPVTACFKYRFCLPDFSKINFCYAGVMQVKD